MTLTEKPIGKILIIDDEEKIRVAITKVVQRQGYESIQFPSAYAALDFIESYDKNDIDVAIVDMKMEGMDGIEFITMLNEFHPEIVPIMITAYSSIDTAVNSVKHGAFDFVSKPFSPDQILYSLQKAMARRNLLVQNKKLRAEAEQSLKILGQETSKLHTVVNCMGNPLLVLNNDLEVVLYNPFFELIVGNGGMKLFKKMTDHESEVMGELKGIIDELAAKPDITMLQKELRLAGKFYQANCARVFHDKNAAGYCIVLDDISKLKEIESMKNQFISMVAHEIKAPISATLGYIYLILDGYIQDRDKILDKLRRCKERSETLLEMVNDLLQISRCQTNRLNLEIKAVDIVGKMESCLEFYGQEMAKKGLALERRFPEKPVFIQADEKAVDIILNNLVSNAIKYNVDQGRITATISPDENFCAISVADTGIGIKKEDLDRLFTEFYRCKSKEVSKIPGTGLGLSVLKNLVNAQHGDVSVESEYKNGSTFTVKLPLSR